MHPTGDGFKVMDGKTIGEIVVIPTYHIKRMSRVAHFVQNALFFDFDDKITFLIIGFQVLWKLVVPFAKWGMFQQLPKPVAVTLGGINGMKTLRVQQAIVLSIKIDLVDHPPGNEQVVAVFKGDIAQLGAQGTLAPMDEQQLIGVGIFVKITS